MTAALIGQGELGDIMDRVLKWFQEDKAWLGKEGIYKRQANGRWVHLIGERLVYGLETSGIRRRVSEAMNSLGRGNKD